MEEGITLVSKDSSFDWKSWLEAVVKAVVKATIPFVAGMFGGLVSGCSCFGPVIGL